MNGGDVGNGVMQGWEQGEHGQRGERSQALPGLAQPACLGRHIRSSWAVQLAGLRQLQLLPAHHGRGAQGQVGGDAPAWHCSGQLCSSGDKVDQSKRR